jgi:uroporphyrinogen decarboxylase
MLGLKKEKNQIDYKEVESQKPKIDIILNKLIDYLCTHIQNQVEAGANVVQIFDSWAGLLPEADLSTYCYKPNLQIVEFCKKKHIPTICFPKGIGKNYKNFNNIVKPNGINLDYSIDPMWAKQNLKDVILQGGMDPKVLLSSNEEIKNTATKYLSVFKDIPYVFNLGHGLLPETDPDKVDKLVKFYRKYK